MEAHIFHEGALPAGTEANYESAIFNLPAFRLAQTSADALTFYLLNPSGSAALAGIDFCREGSVARSPYQAPFGSLECSAEINPKLLYNFLERVASALKEKGITEIRIKNPPRAYGPDQWSLIETFLLNQRFEITEAEVGAVLSVGQTAFIDGIRHAEKLRLRQGREAGFRFHALPLARLPEVFAFISRCHQEKGYRLSVTEGALQKTVRAFPDRYLLFAVCRETEIVSASIAIRVKKNILYNFLVNHDRALNHLSPPVLLMEGMCAYCRQNAIALMDLGTSALQGKPNFSLLDFKFHMGGVPTSKLSFRKIID